MLRAKFCPITANPISPISEVESVIYKSLNFYPSDREKKHKLTA